MVQSPRQGSDPRTFRLPLVWKTCHLWSTMENRCPQVEGFFLSGSIDWRKDDLTRPLRGLRRGKLVSRDCNEHSCHYATHSTACSISLIPQNSKEGLLSNLKHWCEFLDMYNFKLAHFLRRFVGASCACAPINTWQHNADGCGSVTMSTRFRYRHKHCIFMMSPSSFLIQEFGLVSQEGWWAQ